MNKFKEARDRGGRYLLEQVREDGGFGDPELGVTEYYKVPAAFLSCGMTATASRLLNWIRRNGFLPDGDFGPCPAEAQESYYYTYHNAWVIKAAQRLGAFDLAQRGMDFLLEYRDRTSGGFYMHPLRRKSDSVQDLWVVAGCGLCAIYTGRQDVAKGVGRWMRWLMEAQPDFPEALWTVYSRKRGVITEIPEGDEFRYVLTGDESRDQSFYHPGIAAGFLCRLYMFTGEEEWLDLARRYMLFCDHVGDYHFRLLRAGKVGWAAAMLYTLTGQAKYREMAIRVGDNLVAAQRDDGAWAWPELGITEPHNDITAELVVWLDEIHQAVGSD